MLRLDEQGPSSNPRVNATKGPLIIPSTQEQAFPDLNTAIVQFNSLLIKNELFWPLSHDDSL